MRIRFEAIVIPGPVAAAVVIFGVVLNASSMFSHGDVRFPGRLDRVLQRFRVTPAMHHVPHAVEEHEANRNFGLNLLGRDRLVGTCRLQPRGGHEIMAIGIRCRRREMCP